MSNQNFIVIKGAREHNLKNVSLKIPKNKLVVFTGISGSGKSSMAFDTLFAEGQRRYVESLSSYARQFLGNMKRPEVDLIEGLSPSIAINQKAISKNPRSTVGTVTEIYDYLRLLFARIGHPHCPNCHRQVSTQTSKQIVTQFLDSAKLQIYGINQDRYLFLAPLIKNKKGDFKGLIDNLKHQGYKWTRVDNHIIDLYTDFGLSRTNKHNIDAVIDRVVLDKKSFKQPKFKELYDRLITDVEQAMRLSNGLCVISKVNDPSLIFPEKPEQMIDTLYSQNFACPVCNISLPEIEPRLFSFNSPQGACSTCNGLGFKYQVDRTKMPQWQAKRLEYRYFNTQSDFIRQEIEKHMSKEKCPDCRASRLNQQALSITVNEKNIYQLCQLSISKLLNWVGDLHKSLNSNQEKEILIPIKNEINTRLEFLLSVGLDYLSLEREAGTLSSGESQRIRLASQIGTGLSGVLYILDEPTIGLHPRDNQRLIKTLNRLRDLGNSVIVVEHDEEVIKSADYIVDFGPLAGKDGGQVIAQGTLAQIKKNSNSLTGEYLSSRRNPKLLHRHPEHGEGSHSYQNQQRDSSASPQNDGISSRDDTALLTITNCTQWNLKNITLNLPLNKLVCVTGVSGSGKSTLVHDTLYGAIRKHFNPAYRGVVGDYKEIKGIENIGDILLVDQSPIGRTPRSNPATYTKIFDEIRAIFSRTVESQIRGYQAGHFSFNVKGGRCQACRGQGQIKIEMQFLPDVYVTCDECHGTRFKEETLEVEYKGKNIAQVLELTIDEAEVFFENVPRIKKSLNTLQEVGLGYLELGQASNTLSGGESQRLKISRELVKVKNIHTLYIFDEPTTGLHFYDIEKLIKVLRRLADKGNSVVIIEHNQEIIKNADWIIDLGPEGGNKGGQIVTQGTLQDILKSKSSHTTHYLKQKLN
ncbi:ATP-binding cassette domain-containing protein [Patescibacteria group bacterium]|nr:ATP-binding cassette domain-containing protein [Patescibacteria group bacterium]MCG2701915.1 ATP-binding cassette domain-containing protein [Candidatus Parcubacteria bacterium]MBU4390754.1 ATP-binding cassette domain-containing protein [Patescibacteria group bacterium]MBU4397567.1 ATP-binding cassette domain-containing protein [Patescibacteria group bacterium]MBU4431162.1 ATP-binding cassette domain-containing protein [Patescibacteria group bacterium]